MKLLEQFNDINQAQGLLTRLRNKGIVAYLSSANSYMLSRVRTGALKVGLWVVLDKQYHDAKALIRNPQHIPSHSLTEEEMQHIEKEITLCKPLLSKGMLEKLAAWALSILLVGFVAYIIYGALYVA